MAETAASDAPSDRTWVTVQKKTFTRWANNFLKDRSLYILDLANDLKDGILLINLLEILSNKSLGKYNKKPKMKPQFLENVSTALQFVQHQGIKLVGIGPEDIYDSNLKLILGLIWTLILRFQIQRGGDQGNAKAELLEWVRKQVAPYGLKPKNFTLDWTDGKLLSALTDSLRPGVIDIEGLSKEPLKDTDHAMEVAHREYDIPRILDAQDMVDVPDELANMTYISYFRDWWQNDQLRRANELEEERLRKLRTADPSQCYAFGPGLEGGTTNNPAPFTIQSVNYFGDPLPAGGNEFIADLSGPENPQVHIKDNGDGTYAAHYVPTAVGQYKLSITLRGEPIKASPFHPKIVGPSTSHTTASGPGIEGARVNQPAPFKIQSRAADGSLVATGNDPFTVSVTGPNGTQVPVHLTDNKDGTYDGVYTPPAPGFYNVEVLLNNENIKNSPFHPLMELGNSGHSYAEGPGLQGGKTGRNNPFTIHSVDADGNPVRLGGDPFVVEISGPDSPQPSVVDNNDGTYSVDYVVQNAGDYTINVTLHGQPIKDAPFHVFIKPDVDPSKCTAEGPGLHNAKDNEPTYFTIYAKDRDGEQKTEGGDPFQVTFEGPGAIQPQITDNGDGTYLVQYEPDVPGPYTIHVTLEDQAIKDAPFSLSVKEGTDAHHTAFKEIVVTIHTHDKRGNKKSFGGDVFEVKVDGPAQVTAHTADNGDGSYTTSFLPPHKGSYKVHFTFDGKEPAISPLTVEY